MSRLESQSSTDQNSADLSVPYMRATQIDWVMPTSHLSHTTESDTLNEQNAVGILPAFYERGEVLCRAPRILRKHLRRSIVMYEDIVTFRNT